ncbi:hypothetical protein HQ400_07870 [Aeromonas jandaei]|nr:hypothetical protein HQ400_07870 [Aeromonas jandaei]
MTGTLKFGTANNIYDIESMSNDAGNVKRYLRKFSSGAPSTIWHETVTDRLYVLATGVTDTAPQFTVSNGDSATFQYPVLTNSPQSSAANSFARKDYVDAIDAKNVAKAGDTMTGNLDFHNDDQGIRVKFPGGSVSNNSGVFGGKGDAAQKDKTNININSWYGVGFSPTVGVGSGNTKVVADGENSIWFNLRTGNMYTVGRLFVNEDKEVYSPLNKPKWEDVGGGGYFNIVTDHIQAKDRWVKAGGVNTGFIPAQSGTAGTSSLGTSTWWFRDSFVVNTFTKSISMNTAKMRVEGEDIIFSV